MTTEGYQTDYGDLSDRPNVQWNVQNSDDAVRGGALEENDDRIEKPSVPPRPYRPPTVKPVV